MKKLFFIFTVGVLLAVMSCSGNHEPVTTEPEVKLLKSEPYKNPKDLIAANNTDLSSLANESTLNLHFHIKDSIDGNNEIDSCSTHLKISKTSGDINVHGNIAIDTIKGAHFKMLYEKAEKLNDSACYLTGLKMMFGIDATDNICLVYQPVRFYHGKEIKKGGKVCSYKIIGDNSCFQYGTTGFKPINDSLKDTLIKAYKSKIKIKHHKLDTLSPFIQGVDVESMIFSFQEIFALMHDNRTEAAGQSIFHVNNDPVLIYNCIRENSIDPSFFNKHSLLLSTEYANKNGVVDFKDKFANLSQLCPPKCADDLFVFRVESIVRGCD